MNNGRKGTAGSRRKRRRGIWPSTRTGDSGPDPAVEGVRGAVCHVHCGPSFCDVHPFWAWHSSGHVLSCNTGLAANTAKVSGGAFTTFISAQRLHSCGGNNCHLMDALVRRLKRVALGLVYEDPLSNFCRPFFRLEK